MFLTRGENDLIYGDSLGSDKYILLKFLAFKPVKEYYLGYAMVNPITAYQETIKYIDTVDSANYDFKDFSTVDSSDEFARYMAVDLDPDLQVRP